MNFNSSELMGAGWSIFIGTIFLITKPVIEGLHVGPVGDAERYPAQLIFFGNEPIGDLTISSSGKSVQLSFRDCYRLGKFDLGWFLEPKPGGEWI